MAAKAMQPNRKTRQKGLRRMDAGQSVKQKPAPPISSQPAIAYDMPVTTASSRTALGSEGILPVQRILLDMIIHELPFQPFAAIVSIDTVALGLNADAVDNPQNIQAKQDEQAGTLKLFDSV